MNKLIKIKNRKINKSNKMPNKKAMNKKKNAKNKGAKKNNTHSTTNSEQDTAVSSSSYNSKSRLSLTSSPYVPNPNKLTYLSSFAPRKQLNGGDLNLIINTINSLGWWKTSFNPSLAFKLLDNPLLHLIYPQILRKENMKENHNENWTVFDKRNESSTTGDSANSNSNIHPQKNKELSQDEDNFVILNLSLKFEKNKILNVEIRKYDDVFQVISGILREIKIMNIDLIISIIYRIFSTLFLIRDVYNFKLGKDELLYFKYLKNIYNERHSKPKITHPKFIKKK